LKVVCLLFRGKIFDFEGIGKSYGFGGEALVNLWVYVSAEKGG
jgi:hypothetical protein